MGYASAKRALRKAIKARLDGALSVPVLTHAREALAEWVRLGAITENDSFRAQGFDGAVLTATVVAWSASKSTAEARGEAIIRELNDRTDRLALEAPFYVVTQALQAHDDLEERAADGPDLFGDLVVMRYQIGQRP